MESYSSLCRLCLVSDKNGVSLFRGGKSNKYSKQLAEMLRIELQDIPGWPLTACSTCIERLRDIVEFKATINATQENLFQLLSDIRIKCEPVEEPLDEPSPQFFSEDQLVETEIVSEVWIKEEIFPEGERDSELSEDDFLPSEQEEEDEDSSNSSDFSEDSEDDTIRKGKITPGDPKLENQNSVSKRFDCDKCGKIFKTDKKLNFHYLTHLDQKERSFNCPKCHKAFKRPGLLKQHMTRVHGKRIACDICGKKVVYVDFHKRWAHPTPDQMRKCRLCKLFMSAIHYNDHMTRVHGGRKFACETCGRKFKTMTHLKYHVDRDHLGIRFKCPICSGVYSSCNTLRSHLKNVHRSSATVSHTQGTSSVS